MKKIILGFLIGVIGTLLILNHFPWYKLISLNVLKAAFAVFLALLGGLVALFQVKANVISEARIKWVEEFKKNIADYISTTNSMIFNFREFEDLKNGDHRRDYHTKYMDLSHKTQSLYAQIEMNLNRNEQLYEDIYQILNRIETLTSIDNLGSVSELENYEILHNEFSNLTKATQKAMKVEWDKSKKLIYFSTN